MVSIIITFFERIEHLRCCLDSLELSKDDFDEVVITDDGSKETTVKKVHDLLKRYKFSVKYCWQPNKGFRVAAARNNGIRNAEGDYLIFFDGDCLILPQTVRQHLNLARRRMFVAGHRKHLSKKHTEKVFNSPITKELLEEVFYLSPDDELRKDHYRFIKRTILMKLRLTSPKKQSLGGHFSIHKKDIELVNGYDENFIGWGGEDEDLGIRLVSAGIYCRSAIKYARVLHMWHEAELVGRQWQRGPNIEYFMRKDIPFFCENGLIKKNDRKKKKLSTLR